MTAEEKKIIDDSYNAAILSRNKTQEIILANDNNTFDQFNFWGKNTGDNCRLKFGDLFLYQTINWNGSLQASGGEMSYPKIASFIEFLCDQTLEFRFVNIPRTWMWNVEYEGYTDFKDNKIPVAERGTEIDYFIPWGRAEIFIFGKWAAMPDWKQLRRAYEKSIWFYTNKEDLRNRAINTII